MLVLVVSVSVSVLVLSRPPDKGGACTRVVGQTINLAGRRPKKKVEVTDIIYNITYIII